LQQQSQLQQQRQVHRLGLQFTRLLHDRRAALWFLLLALGGATQFGSLFVITLVLGVFRVLTKKQGPLSSEQLVYVFAGSVVIGIAATIVIYWRYKDTFFDPPKDRIPRKRWRRFANRGAVGVAVIVCYTSCWIWVLLLIGLVALGRLVNPLFGLPGHPLLWIVPVPAGLALWAFVAWRHVALDVLEKAEPPELRLAVNLKQHVDAFQEHAAALEEAFEEAAVISKKMQHAIELDQERLRELHEQYRREVHLRELSAEEISAIRIAIAQEQARGTRWSIWLGIMFLLVGWAAGLVTDALIDAEAYLFRS
jgi:hypothetical protein